MGEVRDSGRGQSSDTHNSSALTVSGEIGSEGASSPS